MSELIVPTGYDLTMLGEISAELRDAVRGRYAGRNLANELCRAGGLRPHASIRALLAMDDLRLPLPATLTGLAVGAGIPHRAASWIDQVEMARARRNAEMVALRRGSA